MPYGSRELLTNHTNIIAHDWRRLATFYAENGLRMRATFRPENAINMGGMARACERREGRTSSRCRIFGFRTRREWTNAREISASVRRSLVRKRSRSRIALDLGTLHSPSTMLRVSARRDDCSRWLTHGRRRNDNSDGRRRALFYVRARSRGKSRGSCRRGVSDRDFPIRRPHTRRRRRAKRDRSRRTCRRDSELRDD